MSLEIVTTPFGKFQIDPQDVIDSTTKAGTLWDGPGFLQPIVQEFGRLGEPGVTILDVGAHHGAFTIWLAAHGAWRVVAVEPVPETYQRLQANLDLNQAITAGCVIPVGQAAYDETADRFRLAAPMDAGNTGGTALLPDAEGDIRGLVLDSLQAIFGQSVSLIKIDAQGCDARVLYGLADTLDRWQPVVVFEWEGALASAHGLTLDDVRGRFDDVGYTVTAWPSHGWNFLARPNDPKE